MHFVGREKETKKIIRSLEKGSNVIISGKYGIGRTSLIRHVAEISRERWQFAFADFSLMPGEISRRLLSKLTFTKPFLRNQTSSKSSRFQLAKLVAGEKRPIIVLDNIACLTHKKLALLQYLRNTKKFQFIALVESFLSEGDLLHIRAELMPSEYLNLSYVDRRSSREFFQYFSEKHSLKWTTDQIESCVSVARGYPLGMKELAMKYVKKMQADIGESS